MATAEELLSTLTEADKVLNVDLVERVIVIPVALKVLGVESDDDVHRLHFNVPRYYGEFDLFEFKIYINFENARGGGDFWPVDDLSVNEDGTLSFSWLVDRTAFLYKGNVTFSVCMKKYDDEGVVIKELNTTIATLPVLEGLETVKEVVENNPSGIEALMFRLYAVEAATGLGRDGYYTIAKVEESTEGIEVTIINKDGTTVAKIRHGIDGYNPIKGVDYFTDSEQIEFKNGLKTYVDNCISDSFIVTDDGAGNVTISGDPGFVVSDDEEGNVDITYEVRNFLSRGVKVQNGLTVAIIGDSISTHPQKNACEIEITSEDVGVELSCYITHWDVHDKNGDLKDKTISLDGVTSNYTITTSDIGRQLTFIPCSDDVGKVLGEPKNYNSIKSVWWQVAADILGFEPIAATWSGSSVTSHTANSSDKKCSYAWHTHTIRTLGKRIPGSMNRIAPDVVLIYRGTNDLSHSKKVRLTNGYFDTPSWKYPSTDMLGNDTYGYKEGLALTIKKIRAAYPRARIVLCTCNVFKRSSYTNFPTNNGQFSIPQMNNAIREVADFFGCHVIDLDKCGITFENCYKEGYITDSSVTPTHPNSSGHALMARQAINDLLNKLHIIDIDPSFDVIEFKVGDDMYDNDGSTGVKINLATLGTLVEKYYVNKSTGKLVASDQYFSYTDIPISSTTTYSAPYARNIAFYKSDGSFISGGALAGAADAIITPPTSAALVSVCYKYTDIANPVNATINDTSESTSGMVQIGDLYGIFMDQRLIDSETGELTTSTVTKYFVYANIAVEGGITYKAPYARNTAFYLADGTFISSTAVGGSASATITTPAGAALMTVTYQHKNFNSPTEVTITYT